MDTTFLNCDFALENFASAAGGGDGVITPLPVAD
jgi:hypothetical protein